ncbi:hypothetical protein SAMN05444392_101726 [Seinonella peptonophila]|uniref:Permease n=1 Tax=Seinonella peptonophila TaxID=112248 RepID=A0A1M4TZJ0_9BACL|nr:hypothetical protein [Seinonella peptonophila]SHE49869.1 hypothetical protein SAMN05444392_101726 [Seinonella peptonophila]
MFAGHFALAAIVKTKQKQVPLWVLMLSTQWLDILFVVFMLSGVEKMTKVGEGNYGANLIYAGYSHSLLTVVLFSLIMFFITKNRWGSKGALTVAGLNFSHWLLDLLVHRPDLPILPGNIGHFPLLGFGLWTSPITAACVEGILILLAIILYGKYTYRMGGSTRFSWLNSGVMGLALILSMVSDFLGI